MLNDPNVRTTVIPLILRLTLAAIFLYHGVMKITAPGNDWGVAWATNLQAKASKPNPAAMSVLAEAGITEVAFYNWGHVREANLAWIEEGLKLL